MGGRKGKSNKRGGKNKNNYDDNNDGNNNKKKKPPPKIVGEINDSDDEEIPEDEAFNSEDERLYGHFFENDSNKKKNYDNDDDDEEEEAESDEEDSDDDNDENKKKKAKKMKMDSDEEEITSEEDDDNDSDDDDDDDDREEEEEEDDGGQYMLSLLEKLDSSSNNKNGNDKSASSASVAASQMSKIKENEFSNVLSKKRKDGHSGNSGDGTLTLDHLMEGIQDTNGFRQLQKTFQKQITSKHNLPTPAPLNRVVANRTQRKMAYQQQVEEISRWTKSVQDNRKAETLNFKPTRDDRADVALTRETLVDKFEPMTDFEREVQQALEDAGQQDERAILDAEERALQDDLGSNKLTMVEYKKRQSQLAQVRALMFYHEQKRHHINKIKSKKYRRIRKKQRDRLKESALEAAIEEDADLAEELKEKEEVSRIQERMTMAHKNTSKWAKRILKRGKNVDVDTRRALSAQLKRGDDLRRKLMGEDDDDDDDGNRNSDDDDDDEEEDLVKSARKVLADTEQDTDPTHGKSGLFKLSFMQKGIQRQREKAQEEARRLLTELEGNERDDYDDAVGDDDEEENDNDSNKASNKTNKKQQEKEKMAAEKEMNKLLPNGELVAKSLEFGNSVSIATSAGITIDLGDSIQTNVDGNDDDENNGDDADENQDIADSKQPKIISAVSEHQTSFDINANNDDTKNEKDKKRKKQQGQGQGQGQMQRGKKTKQDTVQAEDDDDDEANPWTTKDDEKAHMTMANKKTSGANNRKNNRKKKQMSIVDVEGAVDLLDAANKKVEKEGKVSNVAARSSSDDDNDKDGNNPSSVTPSGEKKRKITTLTQEELVRQAFATPSEQDVDEEFQREKERIHDENDPTRKSKKSKKDLTEVAGWGSWTGAGALPPPPSSYRRKNLPKKLQPPEKKKKKKRNDDVDVDDDDGKKRRKDGKKPNVIINQKRLKNTANAYTLADVPHPFASRAEYEQAMLGGVGREWNVTDSYKNMTRPEILTRSGKIIQPISKKAKVARPAAKF